MSKPIVFVSSTWYDLRDARAVLKQVIEQELSYECRISESHGFPVDPSKHRHDAAIAGVKGSSLFVLVIGSRYGTGYYKDKSRSVTNVEYTTAKENGIPVFVFVRQEVLNEWRTYKENPTIAPTTVDDSRVFSFLDVIDAQYSQWIFPFGTVDDIVRELKLQISNLVASLLIRRDVSERNVGSQYRISTLKPVISLLESGFENESGAEPYLAFLAIPASIDEELFELDQASFKASFVKVPYTPAEGRNYPFTPLNQDPVVVETIDGVEALLVDDKHQTIERLKVNRSGLFTYQTLIEKELNSILNQVGRDQTAVVNPYFLTETIVVLSCMLAQRVEQSEARLPYLYGIKLGNMRGYSISSYENFQARHYSFPFNSQNDSVFVLIYKFLDPSEPIKNSKMLLDRLFTHAGFDGAPFFGLDGSFQLGRYTRVSG